MNDLLKEAIADAKAVRETAMANAKLALEEAFTPRLQSMLSAKLSEEEEMEDEPADEPAPAPAPEPVEEEDDMELMDEEDDMESMDEEDDMEPMDEEEDDMELEAIIRELEGDMEEPVSEEDDMEPMDEEEDMEEPVSEEEEEVSIDEIIRALREEDGEEEAVTEEDGAAEEELKEAYKVIRFLRSKINEVNLLNAKLLFSNKLFRNYSLNESQKVKVIENFDRARTIREVKLVFSTLAESFTTTKPKTRLKESYASKSSRSTKPSKQVINEGNDLAARWKKLANI
jgi:hypothetical protein